MSKEVYDEYFEETQNITCTEPITIKRRKRKKPYLEIRDERKRKKISVIKMKDPTYKE